MTWAIDHPQRHRRFGRFGRGRRVESLPTAGVRAFARPLGAGGVGVWTLLLAAWAGISVFVGPLFDFRPTTTNAWEWTMQNWLLHLVPGAVGVFAGLVMLGTIGARGAVRRGGLGIGALLTMAAGAWLVIGPAAYRWFESAAAFAPTGIPRNDFVNQIGANLGPGVLLAILGGMALKAGIANPRVVLEHEGDAGVAPAAPTPASAGAGPMMAGTAMGTAAAGTGTVGADTSAGTSAAGGGLSSPAETPAPGQPNTAGPPTGTMPRTEAGSSKPPTPGGEA